MRPNSLSMRLSISSGAEGPGESSLLKSDDFDSSDDGSVGPEIGRSGERKSNAPPILSTWAEAGSAKKMNHSQPTADRTRQPITHHRAVPRLLRLVAALDLPTSFPEQSGIMHCRRIRLL